MKTVVLGLAAALSLAAGSSFAASPLTAVLKTPVSKHTQFVRTDTAWSCDADKCTAQVVGVDSDGWAACRDLTKSVGQVVSYGSLDAAGVAKCNGEKAK